jgi:hypothetical protein
MSKRSITKVRIEVSFTLPAGRTPTQAVEHLRQLLSDLPTRPTELAVRLLGKETRYL